MENFTRRVAGWFLLCLAMSMSLSAAAQQPPVERVDVETIPVQDDLEEMVIESQPESTNHPKQEKDVDTDDDDRAAAVRTDAGQDENVGQGELSQKDRRRDKGDGRENDDEDDDEDEGVRVQTHFEISAASGAQKEEKKAPPVTIDLLGTLRAKFEYQPGEGDARFQVRNARFGVAGEIYSKLAYCMEIDLSDEGKIKMVNAYLGTKLYKGLGFTIGYMRVPFTIDAHRSPHTQYFANRSFIAKQVGSVRDVGATLGWKFGEKVPINLQVGMFNGSGIDDQKDFWTDKFNYAAKAQFGFAEGMNFVVSYQTTRPADTRIHLYDVGCSYRLGGWFFEAEYLRKEYARNSFAGVNAFDGFFCYDLPLRRVFKKMSFAGRYDYMSDHSNGIPDDNGLLFVNDLERHRVTAGITFSFGLPLWPISGSTMRCIFTTRVSSPKFPNTTRSSWNLWLIFSRFKDLRKENPAFYMLRGFLLPVRKHFVARVGEVRKGG